MRKILYPTPELVIEYNLLALSLIPAKKADRAHVMSHLKLDAIIENCKKTPGDIYDKAVYLLTQLIQKHPFASGNRRTAFITTKSFLLMNKAKLNVKDDPKQARIMTGIREHFYTPKEIKEWLKHGKIREFKR